MLRSGLCPIISAMARRRTTSTSTLQRRRRRLPQNRRTSSAFRRSEIARIFLIGSRVVIEPDGCGNRGIVVYPPDLNAAGPCGCVSLLHELVVLLNVLLRQVSASDHHFAGGGDHGSKHGQADRGQKDRHQNLGDTLTFFASQTRSQLFHHISHLRGHPSIWAEN